MLPKLFIIQLKASVNKWAFLLVISHNDKEAPKRHTLWDYIHRIEWVKFKTNQMSLNHFDILNSITISSMKEYCKSQISFRNTKWTTEFVSFISPLPKAETMLIIKKAVLTCTIYKWWCNLIEQYRKFTPFKTKKKHTMQMVKFANEMLQSIYLKITDRLSSVPTLLLWFPFDENNEYKHVMKCEGYSYYICVIFSSRLV